MLRSTGRTGTIASEEEDLPVAVEETYSGNYVVVFDPLDGSSNIDAGISVGSIWGARQMLRVAQASHAEGDALLPSAGAYCCALQSTGGRTQARLLSRWRAWPHASAKVGHLCHNVLWCWQLR